MWRLALVAACLGISLIPAERSKPRPDPKITSIHPLAGQSGTTWSAVVRGTGLSGTRAVVVRESGLSARIIGIRAEEQADGKDSSSAQLVDVEFTAASGLTGKQPFRLVSDGGVTNELSLSVSDAVTADGKTAGLLQRFPVVINGRIEKPGESGVVWLETKAGQTLTFTATSGNGTLDPSLSILEQSGSWFDPGRLNIVAFNDEPLYFPGLSTDARLVHTFSKPGRYALQIRAFSGQGGPDHTYQVRIDSGTGPEPGLHPLREPAWDERMFTRKLVSDWLARLARRGGQQRNDEVVPVVQAGLDAKSSTPVKVPVLVEGSIQKSAETHRVSIQVDNPQDLAIEIETPQATLPRFNPVVRFLAPDGSEIVTNVYTKRNNNGLYMMKMIQAKSTFSVRASGSYTLEIRDITTDIAGKDFHYRVLVRPQIPHLGKIEVAEDRINLEPGEAKPLTVHLDREESFTGLASVSAEGLPEGVTVMTGMANPVEKPPLPNGGRLERYVGKPQTASLMIVASPEAHLTELPTKIRVVASAVTNSRTTTRIIVKELPLMVIPRRPS